MTIVIVLKILLHTDNLIKQGKNAYSFNNINDRGFLLWVILVFLLGLLSNQRPQSVKVDSRHVMRVLSNVEMSHSNLKCPN